ncbi:hypothetical protein AVEN_194484-1 [Araneus ventricosus]|uniref:Uncharacterized protein n=1 Tax=Araneus ventricosus TaxID=182803 RepID=A0A4Y2A8K3_ARAVE|nr:hypothetical protein AVEN_194484-1 [Araneus ventricosus]
MAAVAYWSGLGFGGAGFQVRNLIPLKICRIWGLLHAKSYVASKCPPAGVLRKLGERGISPGGCPRRLCCEQYLRAFS